MPQPSTLPTLPPEAGAPSGHAAPELDQLRARVDAGGSEAVRAALALLERGLRAGDLAADADRLLAVARRPSTRPEVAGLIAAQVAETRAYQLLQVCLPAGVRPDPGRVRPIVEAAEFAYHRAPQRAQARTSVALARLLADRPTEARNFLVGLNTAAMDVRARVNVAAVRVFAALELGDVAQARRVVDAASRVDPEAGLLPLARLAVEQAERRVGGLYDRAAG
jgi:hypothetical protein